MSRCVTKVRWVVGSLWPVKKVEVSGPCRSKQPHTIHRGFRANHDQSPQQI